MKGRERVASSDDTRFALQYVDDRIWVCHCLSKQLLPLTQQNMHRSVVVLWGMFSMEFLGSIVFVESTMSSTHCLNIIVDHLHDYMVPIFKNINGVFMYDNASCHMARIVLNWSLKCNTEFQLTSWQSNQTDLNSTEDVSKVVQRTENQS